MCVAVLVVGAAVFLLGTAAVVGTTARSEARNIGVGTEGRVARGTGVWAWAGDAVKVAASVPNTATGAVKAVRTIPLLVARRGTAAPFDYETLSWIVT